VSGCKTSYKTPLGGDKVEFEIEDKGQSVFTAINIRFLANSTIEEYKNDFLRKKYLKGYLINQDGIFYVKDLESYLLFRVLVSSNEINLKVNYDNKLKKLIEYKIVRIKKNLVEVVLKERDFVNPYNTLEKGVDYTSQIVEVNNWGLRLRVAEHMNGF